MALYVSGLAGLSWSTLYRELWGKQPVTIMELATNAR